MRLRIDLSPDACERLADVAARERRPLPAQAEVLLLRALGLWRGEVLTEREAAGRPPQTEEVRHDDTSAK